MDNKCSCMYKDFSEYINITVACEDGVWLDVEKCCLLGLSKLQVGQSTNFLITSTYFPILQYMSIIIIIYQVLTFSFSEDLSLIYRSTAIFGSSGSKDDTWVQCMHTYILYNENLTFSEIQVLYHNDCNILLLWYHNDLLIVILYLLFWWKLNAQKHAIFKLHHCSGPHYSSVHWYSNTPPPPCYSYNAKRHTLY